MEGRCLNFASSGANPSIQIRAIPTLHAVACLARSPEALANVLEASGQVALERAGAILGERVAG
jgi:hypothetical protein